MDLSSLFYISYAVGDQPLRWSSSGGDDSVSSSSSSDVAESTMVHNASAATVVPVGSLPMCQLFLVKTIGASSVRIWDLAMLIPNLIFFMYLLFIFRKAVSQLRLTSSSIFTAFFVLVLVANVMSVLRSSASIILRISVDSADLEDRIMWLLLKFFLLATELSVVTFGLLFGHLDSRTSIQRVLVVTFLFSFFYSATQGTLEFVNVNMPFHNISYDNEYYTLFGHGGMIFWFISSFCLFLIYGSIVVLPLTRIQQRFTLPTKKSFFCYCFLLSCLNFIQAIGSALLYFSIESGMCVVNLTAYLYFAGFAPLVYATFLHHFFSVSSSTNGIRISYKLQVDEDDDMNLPHQVINYDSQEDLASGTDFSSSVDSTPFNSNPLYIGLNTQPELTFIKDHFTYSQVTAGKLKINELHDIAA